MFACFFLGGHPLEVLGISGVCLLRSQANRRLAHCATEDF